MLGRSRVGRQPLRVFDPPYIDWVLNLNHIHPVPRAALGLAALLADAGDDQAVAGDAKLVLAGHLVAQFDEVFVLELQQPVALGAMEMIVLGIAVIVLINGTAVEDELAQQPRIDELAERAIDGRSADVPLLAAAGKLLHELIGIEMLMPREDLLDQCQPLLRDAHVAALQVFDKPLAGREGDGHATQRILIGHKPPMPPAGTASRLNAC